MTVNITLSSKGKTGKNTVIEGVKDYIYELPDSDFSKATAIVFDKIENDKSDVLPSSKFLI